MIISGASKSLAIKIKRAVKKVVNKVARVLELGDMSAMTPGVWMAAIKAVNRCMAMWTGAMQVVNKVARVLELADMSAMTPGVWMAAIKEVSRCIAMLTGAMQVLWSDPSVVQMHLALQVDSRCNAEVGRVALICKGRALAWDKALDSRTWERAQART
jgi:hypothetical protein